MILFDKTYPRREFADCAAVWRLIPLSPRERSAYKPLLCEVLRGDLLGGRKAVTIVYPVVAGDEPLRFRLECYPLESLYPDCRISYEAQPQSAEGGVFYTLRFDDGGETRIFAPVKWKNGDLCVSAWHETQGAFTDPAEAVYDDVCRYLAALPEAVCRAGLGCLGFDIRLEGQDTPLAYGHEALSLAEALHEDLYFGALEILQQRLGLPAGDRSLQIGQILPLVRYAAENRLRIMAMEIPFNTSRYRDITNPETSASADNNHTTANPEALAPAENTHSSATPEALFRADNNHITANPEALVCADKALSFSDIYTHLQALGGERFCHTSTQGRKLQGTIIRCGNAPALAISAGQHANETSGIVGALRAAYDLKTQGNISFSLRPLGNPDGYAAFLHLCAESSPRHMHHAARYTASGCDFPYADIAEKRFADAVHQALPQALIHLNLHGYPAHEWTRPFSGYVPRHFARWMIPKGFFLIIRHRKTAADLAQAALQAGIDAVLSHPGQVALNRVMLKQYRQTLGDTDFPIAHDTVPYLMETAEDLPYEVEIVTEAPDETVNGQWFRIAQESHYRVIMAVAEMIKNTRHKRFV